jgi:2,3-bisphosphoglycerate-dependent phosphoglycerate mutase
MYGSLTGLSKAMVKQQYGEKQFKAWRRGYAVKPPRVSSFSPQYPGMLYSSVWDAEHIQNRAYSVFI